MQQPKAFGLTKSTGYVEGEVLHYTHSNGAFSPAIDPLSTLSTQELEAVAAQGDADMNARKDGYWSKFVPTTNSEDES